MGIRPDHNRWRAAGGTTSLLLDLSMESKLSRTMQTQHTMQMHPCDIPELGTVGLDMLVRFFFAQNCNVENHFLQSIFCILGGRAVRHYKNINNPAVVVYYLVLHNKLAQNGVAFQEFRSILAGQFYLGVSQEVAVKTLAGAAGI